MQLGKKFLLPQLFSAQWGDGVVSLKPARCSSRSGIGEAEARGSQRVQGQPGLPVVFQGTQRDCLKKVKTNKKGERDLSGAPIPFPAIVFDQMVESRSLRPDLNDSPFPEVNS